MNSANSEKDTDEGEADEKEEEVDGRGGEEERTALR